MKIDEDQIAAAWRFLDYPGCVVRWAAIKGGRCEGSWAQSPMELVQFARAYVGWNFYVQPNPSAKRHGNRCGAADIAFWRWFLIDIDPVDGAVFAPPVETEWGPCPVELAEIAADTLQGIAAYSGTRAYAKFVFSGRGIQLWIPLDAVDFDNSSTSRHKVQACQRYWLEQLERRRRDDRVRIDVSACADLPRLFRCPGTVNQKTGEMARFLHSFEMKANPGLASKILAYTPDYAQAPPPEAPTMVIRGSWQAAVAYMSREGANFLTYGAVEPGRHRAACAAARSLAELGVAESEIVDALTLGCARSRPAIEDPAYIARTAREALRYVGRK